MIDTTESAEPKKKPKKLHDPMKYTQQQIEVLEALDENQELTSEQRRIHEEIKAMDEEDDLGGMFADEYGEEEAPVV